MNFWVYMMSNEKNGTIYTGSCDDLYGRVWQHKNGIGSEFTKKYKTDKLVFFEPHESRESSKYREMQIKAWNRNWKINLIEQGNPAWNDLASHITKDYTVQEWTPACAGVIGERK